MSKIKDALIENGVKPNLKGFEFLATAIELYAPSKPVVYGLYSEVAKTHGTTRTRAERAIRHAIQNSKLSGTNSEVIAFLNYKLLENEKLPAATESSKSEGLK